MEVDGGSHAAFDKHEWPKYCYNHAGDDETSVDDEGVVFVNFGVVHYQWRKRFFAQVCRQSLLDGMLMRHSCHFFVCPVTTVCLSVRVQLKCDGTQWRMGGEVKGKLANGVGSQYSSHYPVTWCTSITTAEAHTSAASSRLNWRPPPRRFKWTRPFRRKTKSGFCACAITFQTQSTYCGLSSEFMMRFNLCLLFLDITYQSSMLILCTIRFNIQKLGTFPTERLSISHSKLWFFNHKIEIILGIPVFNVSPTWFS